MFLSQMFTCLCDCVLESTMEMEPLVDDLKGDLKQSFETYNELFYSFQEKVRKQNELSQVCFCCFIPHEMYLCNNSIN